MVKIFKLILLPIIVMFSLSGCVADRNEDARMILFNEGNGVENSLIYKVNPSRLSAEEASNVEITLENQSSDDIITSNYYWIEEKTDDQWENIPIYEDFEDVEIIIEPNDDVSFSVSLKPYEDASQQQTINLDRGSYRIRKEYNIEEFSRDREDMYIVFEVVEE